MESKALNVILKHLIALNQASRGALPVERGDMHVWIAIIKNRIARCGETAVHRNMAGHRNG